MVKMWMTSLRVFAMQKLARIRWYYLKALRARTATVLPYGFICILLFNMKTPSAAGFEGINTDAFILGFSGPQGSSVCETVCTGRPGPRSNLEVICVTFKKQHIVSENSRNTQDIQKPKTCLMWRNPKTILTKSTAPWQTTWVYAYRGDASW